MISAAVIRTGFIGSVQINALRRLGVPIVGVLGSSAARGRERASALGIPKSYDTIEALIADPDVKVVHITSPNREHFSQVKKLLAGGKHIICEKPLAMTSIESAEMLNRARHQTY